MADQPDGLGPRDRIERLYDEHAAGMYRYALMILADHAAAADVVQQVFARIVAGGRMPGKTAAGYLLRATRNECFSVLRQRQRVQPTEAPLLETMTDAAGPDHHERLVLEQALRGLPADQREVVHLKVFEGLTFQQIADLTGESINTMASRYRYAIERLRKVL